MKEFIEIMESLLHNIVALGSIVLELVGILVMLDAAFHGVIRWIKREEDGPKLEEGILSALEFMMCGEVLKTVTANGNEDYIALGAIILLRFALAFEVQWELKNKAWHEAHAHNLLKALKKNRTEEPPASDKTEAAN